MFENTTCYSAKITSYFADHAGITIDILGNKERLLILPRDMEGFSDLFAGAADDKNSFKALRAGMTASVFIKSGDNPMTADIVAIAPNYS